MFKGIAFVLAACGVWVLVNASNLQEFLDAYSARNQELEQIEILEDRITRKKRQLQSLTDHGVESERLAREHLNMHLPGERVIFLKSENTTQTEARSLVSTAHLPPALPPEPPAPKEAKPASKRKTVEKSQSVKKPTRVQ